MNYSELSTLSVAELRNINQIVVDLIKQKRNIESLQKKVGLHIGMKVKVNHPKLEGAELKVEKINRTKAVLSTINFLTGRVSNYTVPVSMIEMF
jgi:transcription antitermination factor NusG